MVRMTCVRAKEHEPSMASGTGVETLENCKEWTKKITSAYFTEAGGGIIRK